jgi:hypothetical protein
VNDEEVAQPGAAAEKLEADQYFDLHSGEPAAPDAESEPVRVRRVRWPELQQVRRFNADVISAELPSSANGGHSPAAVFGRIIPDEDALAQLLEVHQQAPSYMLMPVAAVAVGAGGPDGEAAGALLVRRDFVDASSTGAAAPPPVRTLYDALQRPEVLGRCFARGSSFAPVLVALMQYVDCVRFLFEHGMPFAAGGVRQLPFLPPQSNGGHGHGAAATAATPSRVQLPASNLLLLSPSLYPHLFDSSLSAAELDARSAELQAARYLSPEGVRDNIVSEATESWAVGVTIGEVLRRGALAYEEADGGQQAQQPRSINQLLIGIAKGELRPQPPSAEEQAAATYPRGLVELMVACTQQTPADRPSLTAVLHQLQELLANSA